jgi:acetolactate synthase I/II/III large subunit
MGTTMNGAESLVRTLLAGGVNVCFTNPGTSEMHFVAALDKVPGMRCVLGLFEGVVTGAADGYYRMLGQPASTLLHLGPGLANGLANLHNAKKANSGIVNIVGEHATYHIAHDAPLTSDIEGLAAPMSHWVKTSPNAQRVCRAMARWRLPPRARRPVRLPR